jgi:diguanylate cyclase (GGDEF)-like protein
MGLVVKVRLPFRLGFARPRPASPPPVDAAVATGPDVPVADAAHGVAAPPTGGTMVAASTDVPRAAPAAVAPPTELAPPPDERAVDEASSTLVWLAYTSALASRATTLEDAALAALEGRLDTGPRRRAARETHKLATSLWLVEAREAARLAWEAAGLLDTGTLLGTANALRLSQIVETLHKSLRTLPPPEALSPAGRPTAPYLLVVDDDEALARELPIEAAVRGWRAKVVRHLGEPIEDQAAVIVLGPDVLGDADAVARTRLLAAHPEAVLAALASGPSLLERTGAHGLPATRTLARPIAPATLVDEAIDLLRRRQAAVPTIVVGITDPVLREAARRQLAGLGTIVEAQGHGEALWNAVTQMRPELCVLDEASAGGAALDLPRAMRREWDVAPTSVVLLTRSGDDATMARVAAAGVDDWLPIVAAPSLLAATVRNRLDRASTQRLAADLDPATRLPHLRSVVPVIERMVAIARRYNHALSLVVVEVDGIRERRAARDDETVDRLSQLLGRRLARAFRAEDLVAHAAPGRFVVAAFGMKSEDGVQRMAEMLESFREQAVEGADHVPVGASFSVGLAQIRLDGPDGATLLRAAEGALATAQQHGGNRIEAASRGETSRIEWTADALVIDADAPFAALVEHALETRGHRVRTIGDGREALDLLTHPEAPVRARLLVLELGLPGLDGLTLLGQLAEAGVLKTSKAVVVTTRSVEAEMIKAMELGAVDYITKPVSLPVLMRRLRSALVGGPGVA